MEGRKYHHGDLKHALIEAGVEILAKEGVEGLSLRKAARLAGVSHAAPYAHFADRQALIAAISTEGFRRLYAQVSSAAEKYHTGSTQQLVETAWAYLQFALVYPAHFKIMFSSYFEEKNYPEFVEISQKNFSLLVELARAGQQEGLFRPGSPDVLALSLWSLVHGFVELLLERQISHTILEQYELKALLVQTLNPITLVEITNP